MEGCIHKNLNVKKSGFNEVNKIGVDDEEGTSLKIKVKYT